MNILDVVRIDRDRLASQFNRLVIILQPKIGRRLAAIQMGEGRIVRALPNRLVEIFNAFVEFPKACSRSQGASGVRVGRVQGERALVLRDGFGKRAWIRGRGPSRREAQSNLDRGRALDVNSSARSRSPLGSPETPHGRQEELRPQLRQRTDIVGIDGERLVAERICRIRLLADPPCLREPAWHWRAKSSASRLAAGVCLNGRPRHR